MAEWVQKGNLKGPQGDPGQDAQLPAGGTEGQVLTKTASGEQWADVPQPDMTGVVKVNSGNFLEHDGQRIAQIHVSGSSTADTIIGSAGPGIADITAVGQSAAQIIAINGDDVAGLIVTSEGPMLKIKDKSVTSITDAISDSPAGNALVTDKAVVDYVTAKVPDVSFASDEDFCEYMGIPYTPPLLAQEGVSITDNRSTKNGSSVHIEATVHVSAGVSGTLFTIPSSIAPSSQLTDEVGWTSESGMERYHDTLYLNTDGSAYINGGISSYDNVKGTVTFDYSLQ